MSSVENFHSMAFSTCLRGLSTGSPTQSQTEGLENSIEAAADDFEDGYNESGTSDLGARSELDTTTQVTDTSPILTLAVLTFPKALTAMWALYAEKQ